MCDHHSSRALFSLRNKIHMNSSSPLCSSSSSSSNSSNGEAGCHEVDALEEELEPLGELDHRPTASQPPPPVPYLS